ncbi:MAG TPA: diguanylate cyclase [Thermoguttaceae bacterium]|nr:diguanylate cyclase [Thermoguttaceae bacterium]
MVFWVIMGVAIGNLLLGFALAVFLNRRYQTLVVTAPASSQNLFPQPARRKESSDTEAARSRPDSMSGLETAAEATLDDLASEPILEEPSGEGLYDQEESQTTPEMPSEIEEKTKSNSSSLPDTEPTQSADESEKTPESAEAEVPAGPSVQQENPPEIQAKGEPTENIASAEEGEKTQVEAAEPTDAPPILPATSVGSPDAGAESPSESKPSQDTPEPPGEKRREGLAGIPPTEADSRRASGGPQVIASPEKGKGVSPTGASPVLASADRSSSKAEGDLSTDRSNPSESTGGEETYPTAQKPAKAGSEISDPTAVRQPSRHTQGQKGDEPTAAAQADSASSASGLEASLERALSQWQAEAARYFDHLSRTRAKVQRISNRPKTEEIYASLGEIHRAGQEYLTTARPARDAFSQLANLRTAMTPMKDHIHSLAAKEETLIDLTPDLLPQTAAGKDNHLLCQQLLQHTDRLLEANRKVQSALEATKQGTPKETAAEGSRSQKSGNGSLFDESMRKKVFSWWEESRPHTHRLSVIILEVDDFERIEEDHGPSMSEGLLRAIEKLLDIARQEENFVIPLTGPRFACFCLNRSMDRAVDFAEYIRQSLIATRFYRRKTELRISISCGVTEATRDDTPETALERAEVAVLQARRYGKGRTFSHDGYFPMPVPAHPLAVAPKEFEI